MIYMIYYKVTQNNGMFYIIKNEILFDYNKLTEMRSKLINECSEIFYHEYKCAYPNILCDGEFIRNYKYKKVGIKYGKGYAEDLDKYLVSYYEYKPPYIVSLLTGIIKGESNSLICLLDILNNDSELNIGVSSTGEINLIDEEIKELLSSDRDVDKIISKVKNLNDKKKSLEEHTLLNVNQKPVSLYYKSLRGLFTYNPIDMIAMEDVDKVLNFFNYQTYNEKEFYKSIKRIKKENN